MARQRTAKKSEAGSLTQFLLARRVPLFWLTLISVGLLAGALTWYEQTPTRVADRGAAALDELPSEQLDEHLDRLVRVGDAGLIATLQALCHPRPEVIQAARRALRSELERWRLLEPYEATRRVGVLADQLRELVPRLAAREKDFAAELASEILLWPLRGETAARLEVIADCEQILRDSYRRPPELDVDPVLAAQYDAILNRLNADQVRRGEGGLRVAEPDDLPATADATIRTDRSSRRGSREAATVADIQPDASDANSDDSRRTGAPTSDPEQAPAESRLARRPGDSPLFTTPQLPRPQIDQANPPRRENPENDLESLEPNRFQPPLQADEQSIPRPLPAAAASESDSSSTGDGAVTPQSSDPPWRDPATDGASRRASETNGGLAMAQRLETEAPGAGQAILSSPMGSFPARGRLEIESSRADKSQYRWWPHIDLMRHLHDSDESFAKRCREELRSRNFTVSQIQLSFKVTHPDPLIRREAAEELTRSRFDPRPWLRWLADDPDLATRAAALGMLATSESAQDQRLVEEKLLETRNADLRNKFQWK